MNPRTNGAILAILLLLVASATLSAMEMSRTEAAGIFEEAGAAYEQGKYEEARDLYLQIADSGFVNGYVQYNLGNACFRLGQLGRSILWYERAARLLPRYEDLRNNLREAKSHLEKKLPNVGADNSVVEFFAGVRANLSVNEWTLVASILFSAAGALFAARILIRSPETGPLVRNIAVIILGLSVWSAANAATRAWEEAKPHAVILEPELNVYPGLDQIDGDPIYRLGAGVKVEILREEVRLNEQSDRDEIWMEIGYPGGSLGWCRGEGLEKI